MSLARERGIIDAVEMLILEDPDYRVKSCKDGEVACVGRSDDVCGHGADTTRCRSTLVVGINETGDGEGLGDVKKEEMLSRRASIEPDRHLLQPPWTATSLRVAGSAILVRSQSSRRRTLHSKHCEILCDVCRDTLVCASVSR